MKPSRVSGAKLEACPLISHISVGMHLSEPLFCCVVNFGLLPQSPDYKYFKGLELYLRLNN